MTSGSPATHVRGDLRLIDDSTTGLPCAATSHLPDGHEGVAFFLRDTRLVLFDLAAGQLVLPRLSLLADVIAPVASNHYSMSQQKYQRQEAQRCQGGNHLVSRWKASS
jgi:hypothetical protein